MPWLGTPSKVELADRYRKVGNTVWAIKIPIGKKEDGKYGMVRGKLDIGRLTEHEWQKMVMMFLTANTLKSWFWSKVPNQAGVVDLGEEPVDVKALMDELAQGRDKRQVKDPKVGFKEYLASLKPEERRRAVEEMLSEFEEPTDTDEDEEEPDEQM